MGLETDPAALPKTVSSNTRGLNFHPWHLPQSVPLSSVVPDRLSLTITPAHFHLQAFGYFFPLNSPSHFLLLEPYPFCKAQLKFHFVPELFGIPHLWEGVTGGEKKPKFSP